MEKIFNFNRFALLVRSHANENRRLFMLAIICMFLPTLLIRLLINVPEPRHLYTFYIVCLIYTGMIYTGLFFKRWTNKSGAISFLMLPVTVFERIAVVLLFTIVLFIPIFTVVYYYSNLVLFKVLNPSLTFSIASLFKGHTVLSAFCLYVLLPFTLFQSFFLLCLVWFKKNQIFIALAIFVLIILINNLLIIKYMNGITRGVIQINDFFFTLFPTSVKFWNDNSWQEISSQLISNINYYVYGIMTLFFYMAAYFKLKEKEI
jgi:hypothetical protein